MSRRARNLSISIATGAFALLAGGRESVAQMPIGSVATVDAIVSGNTATDNSRSVLIGNVTVTAKDHPAYVELLRGGSVKVCSTSGVHLTAGNPIAASPPKQGIGEAASADTKPPASPAGVDPQFPLMVSLDRGAAELHTSVLASDVLMTPDLKMTFSEAGPLDLRVRVASNGDTCVENRVAGLGKHPALEIGSLFGNENYQVLSGQHVMFEHGSLREVVDNESSPCGCPDQAVKKVDAAQNSSQPGGIKLPAPAVATQYPFPAAVSQGLAPPPPAPQAEPGVVHTQVATTLTYKSDQPSPPPVAAPAQAKVEPAPKTAKPPKTGVFHGIGSFFKKIFGGG